MGEGAIKMGRYLWEEDCEEYPDDWVCVWAGCELSTDAKHGLYSMRVHRSIMPVSSTLSKNYTPVTLPSKFDLYFWLKIPYFSTLGATDTISFGLTTGTVGIGWTNLSTTHVQMYVRNLAYNSLAQFALSQDDWHLIRLNVEQIGTYVMVKLYVDGEYKCELKKEWTFGALTSFLFQDTLGDYDVHFDWFKIPNPDWFENKITINSEPYECIDWRERQGCKVAVRNIPLRTSGSFVDTGTWTLKNRRLYITIRLTDTTKAVFQALFNGHVEIVITAKDWTYIGWFVTKPLVYEYSVNGSGNTREWLVEAEFALSSFYYDP